MHIFRYKKNNTFPYTGMSVAMGNFDGLHVGHKSVINMAKSDRSEVKFGVLTFDPHPKEFFAAKKVPFKLMSRQTKNHAFKLMGLDTLIEIPFDQDISRLEPEMFIQELLVKYFKFSCVVVGEDFKFGFERRGNANLLKDIGRTLNLDVKIAPLVKSHGNEISSTAIRKVLAEGKPEEAAKMLGRWYSIAGIVSKGDQRGRTLGFPTINLQLKNLHLPKFGIYSAIVNVWTGSKKGSYLAVASIGARPTYGEREPNLEAYLFNFSGNLYFEDVEVSLVHFQRPEVKFDSSEQLVEQMKEDCRIAEKTLKKLANI